MIKLRIGFALNRKPSLMILKHIEEDDWQWISSDAVLYEIHKTPNDERRERLNFLNSRSTSHIPVNSVHPCEISGNTDNGV